MDDLDFGGTTVDYRRRTFYFLPVSTELRRYELPDVRSTSAAHSHGERPAQSSGSFFCFVFAGARAHPPVLWQC